MNAIFSTKAHCTQLSYVGVLAASVIKHEVVSKL